MIRTTAALALTCALLSGCAATAPPVLDLSLSDYDMFAAGTQTDFWTARMSSDEVFLLYESPLKAFEPKRKVEMTTDAAATTWSAPGFSLTLIKQPCEVLGIPLDYTATLTMDGRVRTGCGGRNEGDGVLKIGIISEDLD